MARTVRDELRLADFQARRFVREQHKAAIPLGYPRMSSFAKDIARGTVSLAPTPEDPELERVGRFVFRLPDIERRILFLNYDYEQPQAIRARQVGITTRRFQRVTERILLKLSGYLLAETLLPG